MILITGTVRLPAANLDTARPIMATMVAASRAEDGCLAYSYAEDVLEPGLIRVNEAWRDLAALEAHFQTNHIAQWRANWPMLEITDRDLQRHEVVDTQPA